MMAKEAVDEIRILQSCAAGDAAAFEVIVRKYQSLVCAITYSAVGQVEKSEELAQQVFINAWKGLGTLNDLDKFKAWLIAIARNVIRESFRHQKRDIVAKAASIDEIGDAPDDSSEPLETIISKEQEAIVYQSLKQIPEKYREPMVLFYRQQQSTRQVAEAMDISEETVRSRLMRGRRMLKEQVAAMVESTLSNTGPGKAFTTMVVASVAGLALTSATATAATAATTTATGTAATGGSSGLAALTTGITAKILTAAAIIVVGVGVVLTYKHLNQPEQSSTQSNEIAPVQDQSEPLAVPENTETVQPEASDIFVVNPVEAPKNQDAVLPNNSTETDAIDLEPVSTVNREESAPEVDETFKVEGQVTNLDGLPIPNTKVILYHDFRQWGLGNCVVEETISNENGSFAFNGPLKFSKKVSRSNKQDVYVVLAIHPDYAFAWQNIKKGQGQESCELILTEPISRTIKVTDHEGNPMAEVCVWPYNVGDRKSSNPLFRDYLKLDTDIDLFGSLTDDNGRATITNLPKTPCSFHATLDGYATGLSFPRRKRIRLSRGASVKGKVLTENDKPVEGAIVRFHTDWMWQSFLAKTDAEGNFFFKDLPAKGWDMSPWGEGKHANGLYKITVKHDKYSIPGEEFQLLPGDNITDFVIDAYGDGTLIKCHTVTIDTNMPVAGARIQGSSESGRIDGLSDKDGVFSIRVEPGPVSLYFTSPPDGVYVLENRNLPESSLRFEASGEEMQKTLKIPAIAGPLVNVFGYVFGPNYSGQSNAVIYAEADKPFHTSTVGSYIRAAGTDYDGLFELKEVPTGLNIHVYAETKDRTLAGIGIFEIPGDPNKAPNIEVNLEPTQNCILIIKDKNGEPVRNISLQIRPVVGDQNVWGGYNRVVRTDSEGLLQADGIIPGLEYCLRDRRFDSNAVTGTERDKLFKEKITLIPLESIRDE